MSAKIYTLSVQDRVSQDVGPVAAMYRDMGASAAELVIARALAELAMTMAALSDRVQAHDLADMARQLRRLQRMSEQLGLVSFATVAGNARDVLDRGDTTAFAAVWARLLRIAAECLVPGRDLLDRSV